MWFCLVFLLKRHLSFRFSGKPYCLFRFQFDIVKFAFNLTLVRLRCHGDSMCFRCVFLSCVLYIVFLLSYVCSPRPNDSLHHLKEKGLKSSTFYTVIHGFRGSVVTLLRIRVNFCRLLGFLAHRCMTFLASSLAYYPNSVAGFRLIRLLS